MILYFKTPNCFIVILLCPDYKSAFAAYGFSRFKLKYLLTLL